MATQTSVCARVAPLFCLALTGCSGCIPSVPGLKEAAIISSNVAKVAGVVQSIHSARAQAKSDQAMVDFAKLMSQQQGANAQAASPTGTSALAVAELNNLLRNTPAPATSAPTGGGAADQSLEELKRLLAQEQTSAATQPGGSQDPASALGELTALLREEQVAPGSGQEKKRDPAEILLEHIAALNQQRATAGPTTAEDATPAEALRTLIERMQRDRAATGGGEKAGRGAAQAAAGSKTPSGASSHLPAPLAPPGQASATGPGAVVVGVPPQIASPTPAAGTASAAPGVPSPYPNVVVGPDGKRRPAPGYRWVSDDPNDLRVLPKAGTPHPQHPNVVANKDGRWVPASGYTWVSEDAGDFRVVLKQNTRHLAYNYWKDMNGDGRATVDELVGVKNVFKPHERLELAVYYNLNCKGKTIAYKLWGPDGGVVLEESMDCKHDFVLWPVRMRGHLMDYLLNKVGPGSYRFAGYVDGKYVGSCEFTIAQ